MRSSLRRDGSLSTGGRVRRNLLLGLIACAVGASVYVLVDRDRVWARLSFATAYASLAFLSVSLLVGPLRVLRGRPTPVNIYLRRDVGVWAGILALVHVAAGLTVHFPGRTWKYFLDAVPTAASPLPLRVDAFGLANHTGLASALVLIVLLVLSNDRSLRSLGTARWKSLQRWNYVAFGLMAAHGVLYQAVELRSAGWVALFLASVAAVGLLQGLGFRAKRRRGGP